MWVFCECDVCECVKVVCYDDEDVCWCVGDVDAGGIEVFGVFGERLMKCW